MIIQLSFASQWRWALALALILSYLSEQAGRAFASWTLTRPWWPRAKQFQRAMCLNFGWPEKPCPGFPQGTSDEIVLDAWSTAAALISTHWIEGLCMVPLVMAGSWEAATDLSRDLFLFGSLMDVGFDVYHQIKITITSFGSEEQLKATGLEKSPMAMFVIMGFLHHPLALAMIIPMNVYYHESSDYHLIAFYLLFAAAVCFTLNAYKMTLDVTNRGEFIVFKGCLAIQLGTILYTRVYRWFPLCASLLNTFKENDDTVFWYGGAVVATLMTIFNLAILNDAVLTCAKWLPKPLPGPADLVPPMRELGRAASCGTASALLPRKDGRFKAAANAIIASNRFASRKSKSM